MPIAESQAAEHHARVRDRLWDYDAYYRLTDEGEYFEIFDGRAQPMAPAPTDFHQRISGNLYYALRTFLAQHPLGELRYAPLDVIFSERIVTQPDLLFVRNEHRERLHQRGVFGAPDLVIEILSPSTALTDQRRKREVYAEQGVPEYWIVDPDAEAIEVLTLKDGTYETLAFARAGEPIRSSVLVGLELKADVVFGS